MGLDETAAASVGQLLRVSPFYGWGWSGSPKEPAPPEPFKARLRRLWWNSGECRGGVAVIEEPGHADHGKWLVLSTRHEGTFNFTTAPGMYNVSISATEPVDNESGWPVAPLSAGDSSGYADIVADTE